MTIPTYTLNREIDRFVNHVGSVNAAAEILDVSTDMLRKMRKGERNFNNEYVRIMYRTKGFRLSFTRLFDLD